MGKGSSGAERDPALQVLLAAIQIWPMELRGICSALDMPYIRAMQNLQSFSLVRIQLCHNMQTHDMTFFCENSRDWFKSPFFEFRVLTYPQHHYYWRTVRLLQTSSSEVGSFSSLSHNLRQLFKNKWRVCGRVRSTGSQHLASHQSSRMAGWFWTTKLLGVCWVLKASAIEYGLSEASNGKSSSF